nr:unnamed protein product [Spirometra erinaceieuropaei]
MSEQWQSPFEERPVSLPTEVEVTSRDVQRSWAISSELPRQHLTNLLKALRQMTPEELYSLPLDARTLLGGAGDLPPVTALGGGIQLDLGISDGCVQPGFGAEKECGQNADTTLIRNCNGRTMSIEIR